MLHQTRRDWLDYKMSILLELHKRRDCEEDSLRLSLFAYFTVRWDWVFQQVMGRINNIYRNVSS